MGAHSSLSADALFGLVHAEFEKFRISGQTMPRLPCPMP